MIPKANAAGPRSLLFFGGSNDRAIYAIARVARICGQRFQAIAWGSGDRLLKGRYRKNVCAVRESAELNETSLKNWVALARRHAPDDTFVIVPSSEYLNAFLLGLDPQLCRTLGIVVPLVDGTIYAQLTNKESATALFSSTGIRTPRELPGFVTESLPLVAKPRKNISSEGRVLYPQLLRTPEQLNAFLRASSPEEYFPQEYVSGTSRYLLAYISRSGLVYASSQMNRAQQPHGKSILLACTDDFHASDMARTTLDLLSGLKYSGFAMIEFITDSRGPCFIELNPRPWGPLQLCVDHDCGIVEAFLGDVLHDDPDRFKDVRRSRPTRARYAWLGGMLQTIRSRGSIHWAESSRIARCTEVLASLGSDVYLRRDSLGVFLSEAVSK